MELLDKDKKETLKSIIKELHAGLSQTEAKQRFTQEIGDISYSEVAALEQALIDEGMSPEEIQKFCNVHAMIFEDSLQKHQLREDNPAHPVYLFQLENREIEKITRNLTVLFSLIDTIELIELKRQIAQELLKLRDIELHYTRKEQLLFPYLEKQGFMGPSKVMWGKDNEIRALLKQVLAAIEQVADHAQLRELLESNLHTLVEEVDGMIFKEENILFPASLEKLSTEDWVQILRESDEVGYAYIGKPANIEQLISELQRAADEQHTTWDGHQVCFPTGNLNLNELTNILNALPVELSFVDTEDKVRYFSDNKHRIFVRTPSAIGRKVQNCHPPQSLDLVEKILSSFKQGTRDRADFWLEIKGKMIYIDFLAIRDQKGNYLGTLELTQDITDLKNKQGEKRLLDEKN
jgi:hypothetical protein